MSYPPLVCDVCGALAPSVRGRPAKDGRLEGWVLGCRRTEDGAVVRQNIRLCPPCARLEAERARAKVFE